MLPGECWLEAGAQQVGEIRLLSRRCTAIDLGPMLCTSWMSCGHEFPDSFRYKPQMPELLNVKVLTTRVAWALRPSASCELSGQQSKSRRHKWCKFEIELVLQVLRTQYKVLILHVGVHLPVVVNDHGVSTEGIDVRRAISERKTVGGVLSNMRA